jgi:peptide deformylase
VLEIRIYGDPVLRKQSAPVEVFDDAFREFVAQLTETMVTADGVGLAAPLAVRSVRVGVVYPTGGEKPPLVLVNPLITGTSKETVEAEEGCLSFPDIHVKIKRPARVTVKAMNESNEPFVIENAEGLLARAVQHEIDHLNGILIIDHISTLQRQLLKSKLKELSRLQSVPQKSV